MTSRKKSMTTSAHLPVFETAKEHRNGESDLQIGYGWQGKIRKTH